MFEPISMGDSVKLVHHLFQVCHYPLPINEVQHLVNMAIYGSSSFITSVTQYKNIGLNNGEIGIFEKIFKGANNLVYDVTEAFRASVNSVIRSTGLG